MNIEDPIYEPMDEPEHRRSDQIYVNELRDALCDLTLLDDDTALVMQALNLAIVDHVIMELEENLLKQLSAEERTPVPEATLVSALSQMWIFAAYEILRTWRQRVAEIEKLVNEGKLESALAAIEADKPRDPMHYGRQKKAKQIRRLIKNPELIADIERDKRRIAIIFLQLEAIRIRLAKHEMPTKSGGGTLSRLPGYGRINRLSGSLDYDLDYDDMTTLGTINRREIADSLRAMASSTPPTDDEISAFKNYLKGPPRIPSRKAKGRTNL